jgi:hypothetical protein
VYRCQSTNLGQGSVFLTHSELFKRLLKTRKHNLSTVDKMWNIKPNHVTTNHFTARNETGPNKLPFGSTGILTETSECQGKWTAEWRRWVRVEDTLYCRDRWVRVDDTLYCRDDDRQGIEMKRNVKQKERIAIKQVQEDKAWKISKRKKLDNTVKIEKQNIYRK